MTKKGDVPRNDKKGTCLAMTKKGTCLAMTKAAACHRDFSDVIASRRRGNPGGSKTQKSKCKMTERK